MIPAAPAERGRALLIAFVLLLTATLGAFALTRALRAQDDVVNAVELEGRAGDGGTATIRFTLVDGDGAVDVLVIDAERRPVRTLLKDEPLASGPHELDWDGRDDAGLAAPPGRYALRVLLGEGDRDVLPPGRIVVGSGGGR